MYEPRYHLKAGWCWEQNSTLSKKENYEKGEFGVNFNDAYQFNLSNTVIVQEFYQKGSISPPINSIR